MTIKKIFDVNDKVIIITGGAGYLGSQYAEGLSQHGANIVIADRNFKECKKIVSSLEADYDVKPLAIQLDITKPNSIKKMIAKIKMKYSRIDGLVNNAVNQGNPDIRKTPFEELSLKHWQNAIDVNLTGVFLCCQEVGKVMVKQKNGVIVNISSTYGLVAPDQRIYGKSGQNSAVFYAATKSGILNLTRYLAAYWQKKGIRVNTLSLGGVEKKQGKKFIQEYSKKTILGRMAKKDEYIGSLIFLLSDASSYMTGSNLVNDGGWTAW